MLDRISHFLSSRTFFYRLMILSSLWFRMGVMTAVVVEAELGQLLPRFHQTTSLRLQDSKLFLLPSSFLDYSFSSLHSGHICNGNALNFNCPLCLTVVDTGILDHNDRNLVPRPFPPTETASSSKELANASPAELSDGLNFRIDEAERYAIIRIYTTALICLFLKRIVHPSVNVGIPSSNLLAMTPPFITRHLRMVDRSTWLTESMSLVNEQGSLFIRLHRNLLYSPLIRILTIASKPSLTIDLTPLLRHQCVNYLFLQEICLLLPFLLIPLLPLVMMTTLYFVLDIVLQITMVSSTIPFIVSCLCFKHDSHTHNPRVLYEIA